MLELEWSSGVSASHPIAMQHDDVPGAWYKVPKKLAKALKKKGYTILEE